MTDNLPLLAVPSLEATAEMKAFLKDQDISSSSTDTRKIDALLHGLFGPDWKDFTYDPLLTLTPEEAFETRQGNCLTFAMLFITLARAIGVAAVFNEIDMSPRWNLEGDIVVETGHINIIVRSQQGRTHIVEWDDSYKDFANLVIRPVSDKRALSHYFNNLGIRSLSEKDFPGARILFEKALELDSTNADAWQNYGVYWIYQDDLDKAEESFLEGIEVSGERSTLPFLLSQLYQSRGDKERADVYLKKAERYAKKNPFYHFNKAMEAKKSGEDRQAVKSLKTAIRTLPGYHRFYYELAGCYYRMGQKEDWRETMTEAVRYAESPDVQQRYLAEMEEQLGLSDSTQGSEE